MQPGGLGKRNDKDDFIASGVKPGDKLIFGKDSGEGFKYVAAILTGGRVIAEEVGLSLEKVTLAYF